jgi:two-component system nitrogen regulation response regulator NtrX
MITGETGTGKEIVANNIYWKSNRAGKPYIKVNAGGIPETLVDSELFGHKKGAFTGAYSDKKGLFEQADAGVLFLDEIANLSYLTQAKVLRAIEYNEIRVVGGNNKKVDVQFIFACNKNLTELVEENNFREDLYYRLEGNIIHLPPLRERGNDIILLMEYFFNKYSSKHESILEVELNKLRDKLHSYNWPGNVRELEKFCEFLLIMYDKIDNNTIKAELDNKKTGSSQNGFSDISKLLAQNNYITALEGLEKKYLEFQLLKYGNKVSLMAEKIGLDRSTLYKKIKKYNL